MIVATVRPEDLLSVQAKVGGRATHFVAISVCIIPASAQGGGRTTAVEITWDPSNPAPQATYSTPPERFKRTVVSTSEVTSITPYLVAQPPQRLRRRHA